MSGTLDDPALRLGFAGLATFVAVGLGIGVAGHFSIDAFGGGGAGAQLVRSIYVVVSVVVVSLVGAPVAATVGARAASSAASDVRAYVAVAASSVVGHVAMFVVAVSIISESVTVDGGEIDIGQFLQPMVLGALGVALAGVTVAAFFRELDP